MLLNKNQATHKFWVACFLYYNIKQKTNKDDDEEAIDEAFSEFTDWP